MTSAYTINLNPNITTPVKTGYTFKAGDKGITFNLAVQEMDPTGTSAKIAFHRANGTSVEASLAGGGPNYSYTILGNEFAVPGVVVADVKFYQSTTQRVSTASFIFNVIGDTLDGLGGGTAGYSDELEVLRAEMEEAAEVLDDYIDAYGELKPLNPRGDYDAATTYHPCDMVYYNGASWINTAESTGQAPATGSAYWMKGVDLDASKADKVTGATNGNLAALDGSGNLTDSGSKTADFAAADEMDAVLNVYGSKNLRPHLNFTSLVSNGVTFTANADGSISLSGISTGITIFSITEPFYVPADGEYIISKHVAGTTIGFLISKANTGEIVVTTETGRATLYANQPYVFGMGVGANENTTGITTYPMLRDARIADATYVPHAMTNRELTEDVENVIRGKVLTGAGKCCSGYVYSGTLYVKIPTPYKMVAPITVTVNSAGYLIGGSGTSSLSGASISATPQDDGVILAYTGLSLNSGMYITDASINLTIKSS